MKIERNYTVDLLRALASFGVIAIHVHADTASASLIGTFFSPLSVPFFFVASLTYFVAGLTHSPIEKVITKALYRLVVPYIAWTIIYVSLLLIKIHFAHSNYNFVPWRAFIYGEIAVQLYFLPDLLGLKMITLGLYVLINQQYSSKSSAILLLLLGIMFFWVGNYFNCFGIGNSGNLLRWGFLIFCGFLLPSFLSKTNKGFLYIALGISLTLLSLITTFAKFQITVLNYPVAIAIGGLGLMFIAIGAPIKTLPKWIKNIAFNSFGIYLCHVFFLEAFETFVSKEVSTGIEYNFLTKIIVVTAIFILSFLFTNIIRKIPFCKFVLLGEKE